MSLEINVPLYTGILYGLEISVLVLILQTLQILAKVILVRNNPLQCLICVTDKQIHSQNNTILTGGPLVVNGSSPDPSTHVLAGLTSYGYSCANKHPGIYTNLALQRPWIDDTITLSNMGGDSPPIAQCSPYVGQVYQNPKNSTVNNVMAAGECCNACKVQSSCSSWAWNSKLKVCTLMAAVVSRSVDPSYTSGNITMYGF